MEAIELILRFRPENETQTRELFAVWRMLLEELRQGPGGGISGGYLPLTLISHGFACLPDVKLLEGPPELHLVRANGKRRREAEPRTARSEARTDRRRCDAA